MNAVTNHQPVVNAPLRKQTEKPTPPPAGPTDHFISDENAELVKNGTEFGLLTSALLGVPAAVGALAGGWGVAASAVAYGVLGSQVQDTSEYPTSGGEALLQSAVFGGVLAGVGATMGVAGAVTCAALGACAGAAMIYIGWQQESQR
ncbi:MAG: hypothetical protein U0931_30205 [Vulcanimicrobiota bacterium]